MREGLGHVAKMPVPMLGGRVAFDLIEGHLPRFEVRLKSVEVRAFPPFASPSTDKGLSAGIAAARRTEHPKFVVSQGLVTRP